MVAADQEETIGGVTVYDEIISFPNPFSDNPNVVATISKTGDTSTNARISDCFITVSDINPNSFKARVRQQDSGTPAITSNSQWYVNWIAIGPQS